VSHDEPSAADRDAAGTTPATGLPRIESISAATLFTGDMARAVAFYDALGFRLRYGGPQDTFTSYTVGDGYLNLSAESDPRAPAWGRLILYVSDVDAMHRRALDAGLSPQFLPRDGPWGERYFHITDPDGHEISFARPLGPSP
jgi:catechol 2,3-dioxygenase-like lactoylglutathione lyase family enzyme